MINVSKLNKYYNKGKNNEIHVINDVSLSLPETGFITLLGKSGSGKTTLLNVIGGLDKATGTISYDNKIIKDYKMRKIDSYRRENIGYVFQNYNLLTDKTVWENLEIALEVVDIIDKEEVKKRIEFCLKTVGLYKYRKKPAFALSGGQMQRVSIARALVKHSKIIIADEPTGNLDSENSLEIMNILKKISKNSLVLLVTHDKQLAEFYSDRIIEICDGSVTDIRETSKDASLAGKINDNTVYLKDMNVIEDEGKNLKYHIYSDDGEIENIEFTIVKRNNQLYLKSNQKIKLLEDSPLKIVDDHYKEINKEEVSYNFDYDTSWYNNTKSQNFFKRIFLNLKSAFKNYFNTKKRTKFFHFALFLLGVVLAFLNISFTSYSKINTVNFAYDKDLYGIQYFQELYYNGTFYEEYSSMVKEAFKDGMIDKIYEFSNCTNYKSFDLSSFDRRNIVVNYAVLDDSFIEGYEIVMGRKSQNESEIVISTTLADQMLLKLNYPAATYSALLNRSMTGYFESNNYNFNIVGIVDKDSKAVYYHETTSNLKTSRYLTSNESQFGLNAKYVSYEVVEGHDISARFEGLVSADSSYEIGSKIGDVTVVGKYSLTDTDILSEVGYSETYLTIIDDNTLSYYNILEMNYYSQCIFTTSNIEELTAYFADKGYTVINSFEIIFSQTQLQNKQSKRVLVPIMAVLLLVTLIYIYFSMRSKMINDIYSIGVYRALGFSRIRMVFKYMCEIFVITLFTSLLGYLLTSVVYEFFAVKLLNIGFTISLLFDFWSTYVVLFGLLVANIVIGLLPICNLMKKTPSEIIAKYDI